jgi:hypothetical protein
MPTRTDESPREQRDRDAQPRRHAVDEPRNSGEAPSAIHTQPQDGHPGYDAELNPIDDELINTRGSER